MLGTNEEAQRLFLVDVKIGEMAVGLRGWLWGSGAVHLSLLNLIEKHPPSSASLLYHKAILGVALKGQQHGNASSRPTSGS